MWSDVYDELEEKRARVEILQPETNEQAVVQVQVQVSGPERPPGRVESTQTTPTRARVETDPRLRPSSGRGSHRTAHSRAVELGTKSAGGAGPSFH